MCVICVTVVLSPGHTVGTVASPPPQTRRLTNRFAFPRSSGTLLVVCHLCQRGTPTCRARRILIQVLRWERLGVERDSARFRSRPHGLRLRGVVGEVIATGE